MRTRYQMNEEENLTLMECKMIICLIMNLVYELRLEFGISHYLLLQKGTGFKKKSSTLLGRLNSGVAGVFNFAGKGMGIGMNLGKDMLGLFQT